MDKKNNPWISMWTRPKPTIRSIVQVNPNQGLWLLASLYALVCGFFTANFYSWGLNNAFLPVFIPLLILSPLLGWAWFSFDAWIIQQIGVWLKGRASFVAVRASVAWSKVPYLLSLFMWAVLILMQPDTVFIQYASGPVTVFISLISLIVNIWSLLLLIEAVREVQSFSIGRAVCNIFLSLIANWIIVLILMFTARYVYLLTF